MEMVLKQHPPSLIRIQTMYEEQLCINGVTVMSMSRNKITIPISQCLNLKTAETKALIDSGAEGKFVDGTIVNWKNVIRLKKPITIRNEHFTLPPPFRTDSARNPRGICPFLHFQIYTTVGCTFRTHSVRNPHGIHTHSARNAE